MNNVLDVANYIIKYCNDKGYTISNLKLQKLLYFVQASFLVETGAPCFKEEIEAWDFGPVVPEAYRFYKVYGSSNIPYINYNLISSISEPDKELIENTVNKCAMYSASQLVEITHHQAPWRKSYSKYNRNIITTDSIKSFFSYK